MFFNCFLVTASMLEEVNKEEEEFEKQYSDWLMQYNNWKEQNKSNFSCFLRKIVNFLTIFLDIFFLAFLNAVMFYAELINRLTWNCER